MAKSSASLNYEGPQALGHPKGLFYLFFAELWERFSFYGMRALLTLYMVNNLFKELADGEEISIGIYASYGALVYATPVIGGILADRFMGYRKSIMLGAVLMALGHFIMAFENEFFFFGALGLLIVGNGFFKPNISTMVGSLYKEGDTRRDAGFTIFYMGINVGAFLAPLVCGWLGETYGWHYGFGAAGVGMLAGLLFFWQGSRTGVFMDKGLQPEEWRDKKVAGTNVVNLIYVAAFLLVPIASILVRFNDLEVVGSDLMSVLLFTVLGAILLYLGFIIISSDKVTGQRLIVVIVLTLFITVFWSFFEQAGSSLTLFAERNVNLTFLNASQTNAINPGYIMILAIPFSLLWTFLDTKRLNPSTPVKFALGILQLGLGFLVFAYAATAMDSTGRVPFFYLAFGYFLITTGEMFISPIGLSKVTELSPAKITALMMGVYFLSSAFAHHIAGIIAKLTVEDTSNKTEYVEQSGFMVSFIEACTGQDQNKVGRFNHEYNKSIVAVLDTSMTNAARDKSTKALNTSQLEYPTVQEIDKLVEVVSSMSGVNENWAAAAPDKVEDAEELKPLVQTLRAKVDTLQPDRPKKLFFDYYAMNFEYNSSNTMQEADSAMIKGKTDEIEKMMKVAAKAEAVEKVKKYNQLKEEMISYDPNWAQNSITFVDKFNALKQSVGQVKSLATYVKVFAQITFFALAIALFAFILSPFLKKMMHGIK